MVKDTFYIFRTELCIIYMCNYVQKGIILVVRTSRGGGGGRIYFKRVPRPYYAL